MHYGTTSYPLDCPSPVWEALKEVQDMDRNINDEIVVAVAEHVDSAEVDLTAAQAAAVAAVLAKESEEESDERDS